MTVENDILRYRYQGFLEHAKGYSTKTIDSHLRAIVGFNQFQRGRLFGTITIEHIMAFRKHILEKVSQTTGEELSASTIVHTLGALQDFFHWLVDSEFPKFDRAAIEYFTPPKRTELNARTRPRRQVPTPEDIARMVAAIDIDTFIGLRDAAVISIIFLTGIRDGALISLRIKHVRVEQRQINQDSNEVETKLGKNQVTTWFPVGEQYESILMKWLEVRKAAGATDEDPLFPKTPSVIAPKASRADCNLPWASATPVRVLFKDACAAAGLPYFNPHSIRNTLVHLGRKVCRTDEEKKAWSQNLGHKHMRTTDDDYGHVDSERQFELLTAMAKRGEKGLGDAEIVELLRAASPEKIAAVRVLLST
ncbi:tyrosine-type recombinase/integrase [Kaistia sp. MMO-174]|uniref:tyrosine-type recombinase/integrase n=1 Tax=Kaistia sp. MMO-174 TaxID=3081256 RepID=UPI003016BC95